MKHFSLGLLTGIIAGLLLATATFALAGQQIKLIVNGKEIQCDVPPQIINGRTLVPVRFVAEELEARVEWDDKTKAVFIATSPQQDKTGLPENRSSGSSSTSLRAQLPTYTQGEKASIDGLEVKIERIEYGTPNFPGLEKGFRIYFSVTNNSSRAIEQAGEFSFKLKDPQFEAEVNRLGYGHHVDNDGYVYPGETASGYYEWYFDKDIQIVEVIYYVSASGTHRYPFATWIFKK